MTPLIYYLKLYLMFSIIKIVLETTDAFTEDYLESDPFSLDACVL